MKKTPSHFTACVEIERQISFFSFGFARVTEVRHMQIRVNGLHILYERFSAVLALRLPVFFGGTPAHCVQNEKLQSYHPMTQGLTFSV